MKRQKLGLALAALCVPLVGGLALTGSAFAEGETPTTYTADDFGGDADFFSCIKTNLHADAAATEVSIADVKALEVLSCNTSNIETVTGIDLFTSLTSLTLDNQSKLESVDLSDNTTIQTLTILYAGNDAPTTKAPLSEVKFKDNTALKTVTIHDTNLATIDFSGAVNLNSLSLYGNNISSINLSKNTELTSLIIPNNNLSSIDLSNNKKLINAFLYDNKMEYLDVSKISTNLAGLYLDNDVLVRTNFIAMQIEEDGKYYASSTTNKSGMFIPMIVATGLSSGKTTITTSGAAFSNNCIGGDAYCIIFDSNMLNYQNYIQLRYVGTEPTQLQLDAGMDVSKQNYRLEINLEAYDPNILVPDTGFFTGQMDGTKAIIYVGSAVLGAGALYLVVYLTKRGFHRNRFRR